MNNETKELPLYKVLNEQRTQGVWTPDEDFCDIETADDAKLGICQMCGSERTQYNAQYLSLAVNNLHVLAEALGKMCEWHEKQATWDKGDNGYYEAKKALSKIS